MNFYPHPGWMRRALACAAMILWLVAACAAQDGERVTGTVRDPSSAAIAGAEVLARSDARVSRTRTDSSGEFELPAESGETTVMVNAAGFKSVQASWTGAPLLITLKPAGLAEQVNVTANRTEMALGETASSVAVLDGEELRASGALTLDDALRQVPGFSLFRRSGSRTANPTAQGVSLRAVGASGASRALVVHDGIPLNDPFGGWVYWGRIPRTAIQGVEVVRGGASSLYGSDALGGVINILPLRESSSAFTSESSMGNQLTPQASASGTLLRGQWALSGSTELFRTGGYVLVEPGERGAVDASVNSQWRTGHLTVERYLGSSARLFLRGGLFRDERENGTPLQVNNTRLGQLATGADWQAGTAGRFNLRAFVTGQRYYQTFSAIAAARDSEQLTRSQVVPAQQNGVSGQWSRGFGMHSLVAGADFRQVIGRSDEIAYVASAPFTSLSAGGRVRSTGIFLEDLVRLGPRVILTGGGRFDRWRNYRGTSFSAPINRPGAPASTEFAEREETAVSPRASLLVRATARLNLTAAAYRSFRAPTLNELYRAFRVGNILTQANAELRAERLHGAEAGAAWEADRGRARGTFFWAELQDPVANATLSVTPALITRQRQNLGSTRTRGLELDGELRLGTSVALSAGYQFAGARVLRFPANPEIEGRLLPQVPRHQFTFQARYSDARAWTLALQARALGMQFEDDQNLLPLDRAFIADAFLSRHLSPQVEAFFAAENIFNQRFMVGRTPVVTLGPPALFRGGVRLRWVGR